MSLDLDASPDDVWRALTDARELVRWFPLDARVTPGAGGSMVWSWARTGRPASTHGSRAACSVWCRRTPGRTTAKVASSRRAGGAPEPAPLPAGPRRPRPQGGGADVPDQGAGRTRGAVSSL